MHERVETVCARARCAAAGATLLGLLLACERPTEQDTAPAASFTRREPWTGSSAPATSVPAAAPATSVPAAPGSGAMPSLPEPLLAAPARTAPPVREDPETARACAPDMVLVSGLYCHGLVLPCLAWVKGGERRCARFGKSACIGHEVRRRFCVDRYEYPNLQGVKPVVMVSWYDALRACELEGKRLCLASEWQMACEGNERLPYPYGHVRDKRVCNFDRPRPAPEPNFQLFAEPRKVGAEVERLDMRVPSGALGGCVSPFGVHDMTGNVDEWVLNEDHFDQPKTANKKPPFISGLKGGYWGPVRAACRPITVAHNERFRFYQVGFRCCADARDKADGVSERYTRHLGTWRDKARTAGP